MIQIPNPVKQLMFVHRLKEERIIYLQSALLDVIEKVDIEVINKELSMVAQKKALQKMASMGLRGELLFPVPSLLKVKPTIIAYYRTLLGYSQKEFYTKKFGLTKFHSMEIIPAKGKNTTIPSDADLFSLSKALSNAAQYFLENLQPVDVSQQLLHEYSLITYGTQLRGSYNVKKGSDGIDIVFNVIIDVLKSRTTSVSDKQIALVNASRRKVVIEFAPDPDIVVKEEMENGEWRKILAIEVKAGEDYSNIHNRIGEAEKSHQKAKAQRFTECWTIVNVDNFNGPLAKKESPSTDIFYKIADLKNRGSAEYIDFRSRLKSLAGIKK